MSDEGPTHEAPTRDYMKYGGTIIGGSLLAEEDSSYEVCMKPHDCHTLDTVPEEFIVSHTGLNMIREADTDFEEVVIQSLQEDPVAGEVTAIDPDTPLDIPDDEQLFDRGRVTDIVNGNR